jgi:hypothetical protein
VLRNGCAIRILSGDDDGRLRTAISGFDQLLTQRPSRTRQPAGAGALGLPGGTRTHTRKPTNGDPLPTSQDRLDGLRADVEVFPALAGLMGRRFTNQSLRRPASVHRPSAPVGACSPTTG